jgi:hypothetical protein
MWNISGTRERAPLVSSVPSSCTIIDLNKPFYFFAAQLLISLPAQLYFFSISLLPSY